MAHIFLRSFHSAFSYFAAIVAICFATNIPLCAANASAFALSKPIDEYSMKALLIQRICRFVEWPDSIWNADTTAPFVVGILGTNPFGKQLDALFSQQRIQGKRVRIEQLSSLEGARFCNAIFISESEKSSISKIYTALSHKPILLLGDTKRYAYNGIHINFFTNNADQIRFEINKDSFGDSQLHSSYQLFNLGVLVSQGVNP